jgi:hypothetical protein
LNRNVIMPYLDFLVFIHFFLEGRLNNLQAVAKALRIVSIFNIPPIYLWNTDLDLFKALGDQL